MKISAYIAQRSVFLGILASALWFIPALIDGKFEITVDVFFVPLVSIILHFFFFLLICYPVAFSLFKSIQKKPLAAAIGGAICGFVSVSAYLFAQKGFDFDYLKYAIKLRNENFIFAVTGALFFIDYCMRRPTKEEPPPDNRQ